MCRPARTDEEEAIALLSSAKPAMPLLMPQQQQCLVISEPPKKRVHFDESKNVHFQRSPLLLDNDNDDIVVTWYSPEELYRFKAQRDADVKLLTSSGRIRRGPQPRSRPPRQKSLPAATTALPTTNNRLARPSRQKSLSSSSCHLPLASSTTTTTAASSGGDVALFLNSLNQIWDQCCNVSNNNNHHQALAEEKDETVYATLFPKKNESDQRQDKEQTALLDKHLTSASSNSSGMTLSCLGLELFLVRGYRQDVHIRRREVLDSLTEIQANPWVDQDEKRDTLLPMACRELTRPSQLVAACWGARVAQSFESETPHEMLASVSSASVIDSGDLTRRQR